jgi:hypothetical protein
MLAEDRSAVANDVESALGFHDIDEINGRVGYRSGSGYVEPGEAADEILDEALQPFSRIFPLRVARSDGGEAGGGHPVRPVPMPGPRL